MAITKKTPKWLKWVVLVLALGLAAVFAWKHYAATGEEQVASGNGRIEATGSEIAAFAAQLRSGKSDPATCLGVKDFTDEDWASLDELVAAARKLAPDEKTKPRH